MNVKRKKKLTLIFVLFLSLCVVFALAFYALRQNLDHFYTPSELVGGALKPGQRLKVGGLVKDGSVQHSVDDLAVSFIVTDLHGDITVNFKGILPDLFREGQGVVVKGVLQDDQQVLANNVLAKHDENYTPPEAAQALEKAAKAAKKAKMSEASNDY